MSIEQSEEHLAIGSTVSFQVKKSDLRSTECSMWLSSSKKVWFFMIADRGRRVHVRSALTPTRGPLKPTGEPIPHNIRARSHLWRQARRSPPPEDRNLRRENQS